MLHNYNIPEGIDSVFLKIQGKAAVIFIVLAGAGLSLLSKHAYIDNDHAKKTALRSKLFKRAFFLFILGFLNTFIWLADILHFYAIFIMISPFFLFASNKKLWLFQCISLAAFIALMPWNDDITTKSFLAFQYTYLYNPILLLHHILWDGCYSIFPWISFFVLGIWLGRQDITNNTFKKRIILAGCCLTIGFEFISWLVFYLFDHDLLNIHVSNLLHWFTIDPWKPTPFFIFSATGVALLIIGISMILSEKVKNKRLLLPFVYVGKTTLTLYITQLLLGYVILKFINPLLSWSLYFLVYGSILYSLFSFVFSYQWCKRFKKGPIELLLQWFANYKINNYTQEIGLPVKQVAE